MEMLFRTLEPKRAHVELQDVMDAGNDVRASPFMKTIYSLRNFMGQLAGCSRSSVMTGQCGTQNLASTTCHQHQGPVSNLLGLIKD